MKNVAIESLDGGVLRMSASCQRTIAFKSSADSSFNSRLSFDSLAMVAESASSCLRASESCERKSATSLFSWLMRSNGFMGFGGYWEDLAASLMNSENRNDCSGVMTLAARADCTSLPAKSGGTRPSSISLASFQGSLLAMSCAGMAHLCESSHASRDIVAIVALSSVFTSSCNMANVWLLVASCAGDGSLNLGKVVQENGKGLRHHCPNLFLKPWQLGTVAQVFGDMEGCAINGATERLICDCNLLEI